MLVAIIVLFILAINVVISIFMIKAFYIEPQKPATVIVLGCRVASKTLDNRINAAFEYLEENEDVLCIASGGKGSDEAISEAEYIKQELAKKGINEDRIILEDTSTNTRENIANSLDIIDSLKLDRDIIIITSEYHQLRAQLIAKKYGATNIYAISSNTKASYLIKAWLRELIGIVIQLFRNIAK